MSALKVGFVVAAVATSIIASLSIQRRNTDELAKREEIIRQQGDALERLSAENQRLSNSPAQVRDGHPQYEEQLTELVKLRREAAQLRRTGTEIARLRTANAKLRAASDGVSQQLAQAQADPNYWPKDQLTFAGNADPASAVKSVLAAMKSGDVSSYRSVCTPGALTNLENEWKQQGLSQEQQDAELKSMGSMLISSASGFHILDQTNAAPDETIINLSFDGEGKARKFVLKKIGPEWKFDNLLLAGQSVPLIE